MYQLLYGRIGLQRMFSMQGIRLHINFEVVGADIIGFETYPSADNLR